MFDKMKITYADPGTPIPFSATVINANRSKRRAARSRWTRILIAGMVVITLASVAIAALVVFGVVRL